MHTPPAIRKIVRQRVAIVTASVFVGGVLLGITGSAGAAPMPTIAQVQHRVSQLESKAGKLGQQYDQVQQELTSANQSLALVNKREADLSRQVRSQLGEVQRIAVAAYEDGNLANSIVLLTTGNPQQVLNRSSILAELSNVNNAQISRFVAAVKQLAATRELRTRTDAAIRQLRNSLKARRARAVKLLDEAKALLASLTPAQAANAGPSTSGSTKVVYKGPTGTQADTAVQFAYDQLGCPYLFGGTACSPGFDCSGLTQAAWAAAGVSIPRTSEEQWADLPHVSTLQRGDIMVFNGAGHVGIYVGNNELIDAPVPGASVELVSFSGWYKSTYDGAVRP